MPKIMLIYPEFKAVLDEYLSLDEFQILAKLTISGKRLALVSLFNYLGDNGVADLGCCQQTHITRHLRRMIELSSSTISGRCFIFRHFFNYLYHMNIVSYSGNELFPVIFTNKRKCILSFYSTAELKQQGLSNECIADKLDITVPTVRLCLQKFAESGISSALIDSKGRGRKAEIFDDSKAWIEISLVRSQLLLASQPNYGTLRT